MKNKLQNFASLLAVIFFLFIAFGSGDSDKKENTSHEATTTEAETAEPEEVKNWNYTVEEDEMSGEKQYFATTRSTNQIEFDFPYNGGSYFTLIVRDMGKGNRVLLRVSKGQFITSINGDEYVRIKFDEDELKKYPYYSSTDGNSEIIFIDQPDEIIEKLKSAKKVKIEGLFYEAGRQIAKFDVEGFTWEH